MYIYTGHKKAQKNKKIPKQVVWLLIVIFVGWIFRSVYIGRKSTISPIQKDFMPNTSVLSILQQNTRDPDVLKKMITKTVGDTLKNYSVYVEDLSYSFSMGLNETTIYTAASVNKLLILAALYQEAQQDLSILDKKITPQANDIQSYGTGVIQYDKPGTSYSVKTLARLMMQKSDNTAAYVLAKYIVGEPTLKKRIEEWGLTQTNFTTNKTSNLDMSIITKKIFSGNIANTALTQEMLSFMKDSDFEDRIPANLPDTATIYHKIGNAEAGFHDVGIVSFGENRAYYIGIFTTDVTDQEETLLLSAKISNIVYNYLK
ncbi:serine hydrolase [Patescibacteria group bacterium]